MDINNVTITGRATKDVEVRTTPSGTNVTTVSLAVNSFNDKVNYFDVIAWDKTAEIIGKYVSKGRQLAVVGRLQQRKWLDKDGNNRYSIEIVASQVKLLGGKSDSVQADVVPTDTDDEDLLSLVPF